MTRAAVYARLSITPDDLDNIPRQLAVGREVAERQGWEVVGEFKDEGRSAYKDDVERPAFRKLLAAAGRNEVDVIVVRETARLSRNFGDFGDLTRTGVQVSDWSGNVKDAFSAGVEVAVAYKESRDKSARALDGEIRRAERGEAPRGGRRPYGYHSGSKLCSCGGGCERDTIHEAEAAVLREAAERWLRGDTLSAIVRDLNRRGVPTAQGLDWTITGLRRTLQSPRLAAIRVHRGREHRGDWEPVFDSDTHDRLVNANTRSKTQRPHVDYLLRDLIVCTRCGGRMQGHRHARRKGEDQGAARYRCVGCASGISAEPVDELVWSVALGRATKRDREDHTEARDRIVRLAHEVEQIEAKLDALDDLFFDTDAFEGDRETYVARRRKLNAKREQVQAALKLEQRELETQHSVWAAMARAVERHESTSWDERRAIIERVVERVEIQPDGDTSDRPPVDLELVAERLANSGTTEGLWPECDPRVRLERVGVVWRN